MDDTTRVRRQETFNSPEYTSIKAKNMTIQPKIASLVNQCKAKRVKYRFLELGQEETREDNSRMTIVVNDEGYYVRHYFG